MIGKVSTWPPAQSPLKDVEPNMKADAAPPKATATPAKSIPRITDGRQASVVAVNTAAKKRTAVKKATTKKAAPAKKSVAKKSTTKAASNGAAKKGTGLDMRDLPYMLSWDSLDGERGGTYTGNWGNCRRHAKAYMLESGVKDAKANELLAAAMELVKVGKGSTQGPVKFTLVKR